MVVYTVFGKEIHDGRANEQQVGAWEFHRWSDEGHHQWSH